MSNSASSYLVIPFMFPEKQQGVAIATPCYAILSGFG